MPQTTANFPQTSGTDFNGADSVITSLPLPNASAPSCCCSSNRTTVEQDATTVVFEVDNPWIISSTVEESLFE